MSDYRLEELGKDKYKIWLYLGRDGKGNKIRPSKVFYGTETKAHKEGRRWLGEKEAGIGLDPNKIKIKAFMEQWIDSRAIESDLAPASYDIYNRHIKNHIVPELGLAGLQKLTVTQVNQFKVKLIKKGLDPASINQILDVLNHGLNYAIRFKIIKENPLKFIDRPKIDRVSKRAVALDKDQLNYLLENAKDHRLYPLILIAAFTGMRIGEICGLNWGDIDLKRGIIKVRKQYKKNYEGKWGRGKLKRSNSARDIGIDKNLLDYLKGLKEDDAKSTDFVLTWGGQPFKTAYISTYFKKLAVDIDMPSLTFHKIRHTHASLLLAAGSPITDVAARLGDTVAEVQRTYAHFIPSRVHEPANVFSSIMHPENKTGHFEGTDKPASVEVAR
jgi:integrase